MNRPLPEKIDGVKFAILFQEKGIERMRFYFKIGHEILKDGNKTET